MSLTAGASNKTTSPVQSESGSKFPVSVDCAIFGYQDNALRILLINCDLPEFKGQWKLPGDFVHQDEDLEKASYRILQERTGLENVFLEQVHTFGDVRRYPDSRVITTAYYSLLNIRDHQLKLSNNDLHWHSLKDITTMALDHKRILDVCYKTLQKKVQEEPIIFNLLSNKFSLRELQMVYETILNVELDRRNFRKKLFTTNLLIDLNEMEANVPHRPGKLYSFNHSRYSEINKKTFVGIDF